MIQFKINPTQNPQNPSHRPKHCLRKIEDLIFIILLWPLINDQHDDILNRNSCQSLKTKFCSVFQNKHFGLWSELWPQHLSVCHSVSRNRESTFPKILFYKYLRHLSNHYTAALLQANAIHSNLLSCHSEKSIHNPPQQPDRSFTMVCYLGFSFHGQIKFQQKSLHQKVSAPKNLCTKNLYTKKSLHQKQSPHQKNLGTKFTAHQYGLAAPGMLRLQSAN